MNTIKSDPALKEALENVLLIYGTPKEFVPFVLTFIDGIKIGAKKNERKSDNIGK